MAKKGATIFDFIDGVNIQAKDRMVLARIDNAFDGTVLTDAKIVIDGNDFDVESHVLHRVNANSAYVEIQARG